MENPKPATSAVQNIRNITSNLILVVVNLLISLWYTPFLIHRLGSELFGFIPLAIATINFLGIVTLSLNTSTGRFLTIELGKGNLTRANRIFNTTLVGSLFLIAFTLPLASGLVILVPDLFNVPGNYLKGVRLLFTGTICGFYLTTLRSNFSVATFAKNRFDLRNIVDLSARLGQISIIVILFYAYTPSLSHIAVGVVVAGMLALAGNYAQWKWLLPGLKLNFKAFKRQLLRPLMRTSLWVFIHQVGATLFVSVDMLVANRTLALSTAGMFGALLVIPKNLRIIAAAVGNVWGPTFLTKFSNADLEGMEAVIRYAVRLIGFTVALPVGLIVGLAKPFLGTWLGPEYEAMAWVLVVLTFHLSVNLISTIFLNIQVTLNKVAIPAVLSLVLGIAFYILAGVFSGRIGPLGIAIAGALTLTAKNFVVMPVYAAVIMKHPWWHYIHQLIPVVVATLGVALVATLGTLMLPSPGLIPLLLICAVVSPLYLVIIYRVGLSTGERDMILASLVNTIKDIPGIKRVLKTGAAETQEVEKREEDTH